MTSSSQMKFRRAFTLIELLAVIVIIAILAAISVPMYGRFMTQARETKTLSNIRQIGAATLLYAGDNNQQLPNRVADGTGGSATQDKWPTLLKPYLPDTRVFSSPIPDYQNTSYKVVDPSKYFDDTKNYTCYIYNGMNDMGAHDDPTVAPRLNLLAQPSQTILFGIPAPLSTQFYMDFNDTDNTNTVLNRTAFFNGTPYVFGDGSSRILHYDAKLSVTYKTNTPVSPDSSLYIDWYWLLNKSKTSVIH